MRRAFGLSQFVLLHLRILPDSDQMPHLQHHAPDRPVVVVLDSLPQLLEAKRADRALLVNLLIDAAAFPGDLDLRHAHASAAAVRRAASRLRWISARGSRSSDNP